MLALLYGGVVHADNPIEPVEIVTGEWPPYTTQQDEGGGRLTRLVSAVLLGMGTKPSFTFHPFYLGFDLTQSGVAAGTFPYYRTPEREKTMLFSMPLREVEHAVFFNPRREPAVGRIRSLAELSKFTGAGVKGYAYVAEVEEALKASGVPKLNSEVQAFERLASDSGGVDFVVAAREVGEAIVETYFFDQQDRFAVVDGLTWTRPVHFLVPKSRDGGAAFLARFNESLIRIREEGIESALKRQERSSEMEDKRIVRLTDPGGFPLIMARATQDSKETVTLPRGSRAVVLEWSENFRTPMQTKIYDQMFALSKVKLLDGPLKGRIVWVQSLHIELP